jgi:hypothetical protein
MENGASQQVQHTPFAGLFLGNRVALAGTWAKMLATLWDN